MKNMVKNSNLLFKNEIFCITMFKNKYIYNINSSVKWVHLTANVKCVMKKKVFGLNVIAAVVYAKIVVMIGGYALKICAIIVLK
jgi:hypothetical protein